MSASSPLDVQPLPYATDALAAKGMSKETVELHYGKHHKGYAVRLKAMAKADPAQYQAVRSVADVVVRTKEGSVPYNMAAQIWNHDFYWRSMAPNGGGRPSGALAALIDQSFGSYEAFVKKFSAAAAGHFGSGWAWLVLNTTSGKLEVIGTHDAVCPIATPGIKPLLVCDVWEHAYYVDFRNDRPALIKNWWGLVNWHFAASNLGARASL